MVLQLETLKQVLKVPRHHTCQNTSIMTSYASQNFCVRCGVFWKASRLYKDVMKYQEGLEHRLFLIREKGCRVHG